MTPEPPVHYEISIKGTLDPCWRTHFGQLLPTYVGDHTVLIGPVADQPALHGILGRIRDLGLTLVSVRQIEPPEPGSDERAGP
jgi:hypothetical protein